MRIVVVIVTTVVLCSVALFANARWVDSQTRPAVARDGGQLINAGQMAANVKVEGAGPTIVLIHGFGAAIDWWDDIAPELAADNRVIRIDLIGHGGTAAPAEGYSIEKQAALVSAVLDNLAVDRVTIIGHSMGGEVATALAEIKPERIERMILIDSPPTAGTTFTFATEAYLKPLLGEFLSHFRSDRAIRRGLAQGFAPGFPSRRNSSPTSSSVPTQPFAWPMKKALLIASPNHPMSGSRHSSRCRHCLPYSARATRLSCQHTQNCLSGYLVQKL